MLKVKEIKYADKELEEFRAVIQEAKDEALDELQMLKERLDDLNTFSASDESMTYSMHMGDQGTEAVEREKTYAQVTRTQDYLKKLDEAMERIEKKTYGICRECNILIAKQRLIAVPITTLSASFKIHKECPEDGIDHIEPKK
jgi:RNA polymerase-binding transcription factor